MSSNVIPLVPKTCPRCAAPVDQNPRTLADVGAAYGCSRCTWPNPSWVRMVATLARKGPTPQGYDMTDEGLEDFAASIKNTTTLKDAQGRMVTAKVVEVHVHDGQVDVTFEYDPNAWRTPS